MKNLFDKAKNKKEESFCLWCKSSFTPDKRNTKRGWGLCCSKSCAASYKTKLKHLKGVEKIRETRDYKLNQLGI